ncbi:MAG TPA: hypothetical protein VIC54_01975 [Terriglobales bacterium]|jgi:hypothetical protein
MHGCAWWWAALFSTLVVAFSAAFLASLMTLVLTLDLRLATWEAGAALGCGTLALRIARCKL